MTLHQETNNNGQIIKGSFREIVENPIFDRGLVDKYFSADYEQHVDGKNLTFANFVKHMEAQKKATKSVTITFKTIAQQGDVVFTNHYATARKHDGSEANVHVIAEFKLKGGKICYCDELTHMLSGDEADRDLGSRVD